MNNRQEKQLDIDSFMSGLYLGIIIGCITMVVICEIIIDNLL